MNAAQADVWPQKPGSNYCGVESAIALVNYDNINSGQGRKYSSNDDQVTLGYYNQSIVWTYQPGMSQWGWAQDSTRNPPNKYGGATNIAPDTGTDPRSISWMTWNYSLPNRYFHDHIYSWHQDPYGVQSREDQVGHATTLLARGLNAWTEPIVGLINGGQHAVLITGIWSGNDIYANYPAAIQGLVYRDPEGSLSPINTSREELNYSFWLYGNYRGNFGTYSLWSVFYGDLYSPHDHMNTNDPEPTVGPYVPGVRYPTHWYDNLDWVQRDSYMGGDSWNPDYAVNAVSGSDL